MKRLKYLLAGAAVVLCLLPATPALAQTDPFSGAKTQCTKGGVGTSAACQTNGSDPLTGPNGTITKVTRFIAYLAGVIAIIIILVAGIMYVTGGDDPSKVTAAKDTVIYALVGLLIVVTAQGIIIFVVSRL